MVDTTVDLDTPPVSPFDDDGNPDLVIIDDKDLSWDDDPKWWDADPKEEPKEVKEEDPKDDDEPAKKEGDQKNPKPTDGKVTISQKELDDLREANRQSTQEGQKLAWVDRVRVDKYDFIKLYESDQAIAAKVLQHVGEEKDPRILYNELRKEKYGESDAVVQKEEILRVIEQKEIKKEFGKLIRSTGLDLDSKTWKEFTKEYDFLTDNWKRVTSDNVESFVVKAMKLAWVKDIGQQKAAIERSIVWAGQAPKSSTTDAPKVKWSFFDSFDKKGPSDWYK